ncbi:hypothetical protein TRVL_08448 [Trypanosoma vivax]|nr:hypothetical protein TRVL_08448 [Trypanosoma vivax]
MPAEMRGFSAQRGEPNAQQPLQWAGAVFPAPTTGEQQQQQQNNSPLMGNVGFRGIQRLRDKHGETSFKSGRKDSHVRGRARVFGGSRAGTLFKSSVAWNVSNAAQKPAFCRKTHGVQWQRGHGLLAKWVARKPWVG